MRNLALQLFCTRDRVVRKWLREEFVDSNERLIAFFDVVACLLDKFAIRAVLFVFLVEPHPSERRKHRNN